MAAGLAREKVKKEHPEIADELRRELEGLPDGETVKKSQRLNWQVYDFMQEAQKPSPGLMRYFFLDTPDEYLKGPEVQ